ncbi:MAG: dethiobiotin synthase, partial [Bacteroidia bacterium]|nr:dethiobiotin synthase [Bacteroidia bacterium]
HYAAKIEGVEIQLNKMEIPKTSNYLIIEGAGGVLVPLNQNDFVIQIAQQCNAEVVLVIQNYLGCINHSLLSINYLLTNGYKLKYLVFNGDFEDEVKQIILANANKVKHIDIPYLKQVNKQFIKDLATEFKQVLS